MNKLFGLFLLALACWAPDVAQAAARFAVCTTTCTWDNTSTAMWSTSSGGATGASAPGSGDTVTFDAATCVGGTTCTVTTFAGTISVQSITYGACTASTTGCIIDASVNNTNFTIANNTGTLFSGTGTGTRKWLSGTGTYTVTRSSSAVSLALGTTTNDQGSVFSGSTWIFAGTTGNGSALNFGGFSFGPVTINANTSGGWYNFTAPTGSTFTSLTINGPNSISLIGGTTQTITGALTLTGSSSSGVVYLGTASTNDPANGAATISLGTASSATWAILRNLTTSGAAALTGSNCINQLALTLANGGACNGPTGGASPRTIGG